MWPNRGYGAAPQSRENYLTGGPFLTIYGTGVTVCYLRNAAWLSPLAGEGHGSSPAWEGTVSVQVKDW
jgi:hypothetical protein